VWRHLHHTPGVVGDARTVRIDSTLGSPNEDLGRRSVTVCCTVGQRHTCCLWNEPNDTRPSQQSTGAVTLSDDFRQHTSCQPKPMVRDLTAMIGIAMTPFNVPRTPYTTLSRSRWQPRQRQADVLNSQGLVRPSTANLPHCTVTERFLPVDFVRQFETCQHLPQPGRVEPRT